MTDIAINQPLKVAGVRFNRVGKLYHFDYTDFPDLQVGDFVIVETTRGRQMGEVIAFAQPDDSDREHKSILRQATPRDLVLRQQWEAQQDDALLYCQQKAASMGGFEGVKFVAALYNYDGSLLTFLYSAEDKVNTGKLYHDLNRQFPDSQVELRQIGPRDVAKLLGGFGACGIERCCSTFLTDFSPISIKMAKAQGISLNPSEITGMCGRLRCCLVYEYEQYVEARKHLPKKNKRIGTPYGEGKVIDVQPLQDTVTVYTDSGVQTVRREEIIPLDEWEALVKKSAQPCDKHNPDEPCDCGAKPGKQAEAQTDAAPTAQHEEPDNETSSEPSSEAKPEHRRKRKSDNARRKNNRGRGNRSRNNRGKRSDGGDGSGGSSSGEKPQD